MLGSLATHWAHSERLWSDWVDAQADLNLCWAHSHFVGFVTRRLITSCALGLYHILNCWPKTDCLPLLNGYLKFMYLLNNFIYYSPLILAWKAQVDVKLSLFDASTLTSTCLPMWSTPCDMVLGSARTLVAVVEIDVPRYSSMTMRGGRDLSVT